jgi:hypothetical protein
MTAPKKSTGKKPSRPTTKKTASAASASRPAAKAKKPASKPVTKPTAKAVAKQPPKPSAKPDAATSAKAKVKAAPVKAAPVKAAAGSGGGTPPQPAPPKPVELSLSQKQQLISKIHRVLKTHYKPFTVDTKRPLLEQVLLACCLENAHHEAAEKALSRLLEQFFDLNEVRVTTVAELAESLTELPDPSRAALALRRVLQSVFESTYAYSLEHVRKASIAQGVKILEDLHAASPFVIGHVTATALGGHAVPVDQGGLAVLHLAGLVSRSDYEAGRAPGIDRLVPKKQGGEFSGLLHEFGADLLVGLHTAKVRKILEDINPQVKDRLPKRGESLPPPAPPAPPQGKEEQRAAEAAAEQLRPAGPQAAARPAGKTPQPPPGSGPKRTADGRAISGGKTGPKPFVVKPNMARPLTIKPELAAERAKAAAAEEAAAKQREKQERKREASASKAADRGKSGDHAKQLAKRKPR